MSNKQIPNGFESEAQIIEQFSHADRQIAKELLSLRQPVSSTLRHRTVALYQADKQPQRGHPQQRVVQVLTKWALVLLIGVMVLFAFPQLRASAAQIAMQIQETIVGFFSSGGNAAVTFSPSPSFVVRQPEYLPDGFERSYVRYQSSSTLPIIEEIRTSDSSATLSELLLERLADYASDKPHILLVYEYDPDYILLFQRQAQPDEVLPTGTDHIVNGTPARLNTEGNLHILTWIADNTSLTLESTVDEASLLQIAEQLAVTQRHDTSIFGNPGTGKDLPLCNGDYPPSEGFLLGRVSGQEPWGRIWVNLFSRDYVPNTVAYATSREGLTKAMLIQRALDALRDSRVVGQTLDYPSISVFESSPTGDCLNPSSDLQGYIVLEIWDQQVNVAFGGRAAELRERAIAALEEELGTSP